jgi:hypothetical protein
VSASHADDCVALPFLDHVLADGPGTEVPATPVPVNVTARSPPPSFPLITQVSDAAPAAVGVNVTVSVTDAPGAIVDASGRVEAAAKPTPEAGGLDFVICSGEPPVLLIVNVRYAVAPSNVEPNGTTVGVRVRTGGAADVPDTGIWSAPADVFNVSTPVYTPIAVGAKDALTVTEPSGAMTEPTAGRPENPNGAGAGLTPVTVTGVAPMLAMLTAAPTGVPPAGAPPKLMTGGVGCSSPVGLMPVDVTGMLTARTLVVTMISLLAAPAIVGVKRTGIVTV